MEGEGRRRAAGYEMQPFGREPSGAGAGEAVVRREKEIKEGRTNHIKRGI